MPFFAVRVRVDAIMAGSVATLLVILPPAVRDTVPGVLMVKMVSPLMGTDTSTAPEDSIGPVKVSA
jgi:hypothetical protein